MARAPAIRASKHTQQTDASMAVSPNNEPMTVTLGADVLFQYRRFSLYNSPYVSHDRGCAIDLYPGSETDTSDDEGVPSPVAGEVLDVRTVRAPPRPYAAEHDYLVLVDTGSHVARLLHVEPAVEPGDVVEVGDPLGDLVRAGFFAPWVPNHIHLGFRPREANHYRASGSVPLDVDVEIQPVEWDGTGTVLETGETWARLDEPAHPAPGEVFVGLESDGSVLDGGFPHYDWGGLLGEGTDAEIAGTRVGTVSGRDVRWRDCTVRANGQAVTGIALFCAQDGFGIKLVGEGVPFTTGEEVTVEIEANERLSDRVR